MHRPIDPLRIHARQRQEDQSGRLRLLGVGEHDTRDQLREIALDGDEVRVVQGFDAGFEDLGGDELADLGGDGGGGREDGDDGAEDVGEGAAGAVVVHAEGVRAEEDDGFEDGGCFEDEGAEGRGVGQGEGRRLLFGVAVSGGFRDCRNWG